MERLEAAKFPPKRYWYIERDIGTRRYMITWVQPLNEKFDIFEAIERGRE